MVESVIAIIRTSSQFLVQSGVACVQERWKDLSRDWSKGNCIDAANVLFSSFLMAGSCSIRTLITDIHRFRKRQTVAFVAGAAVAAQSCQLFTLGASTRLV